MTQIPFRRLRPDAILPRYAHDDDVGMDVCAATAGTLLPGERTLVPTGLAMALPPTIECQVRPRSGLAIKSGITVLNTPGTIDPGYRGELAIILINLSQESFHYTVGMRIAQLVFAPILRIDPIDVSELDQTTRGQNGFGSTGVNS